jgi:hypothetical protein
MQMLASDLNNPEFVGATNPDALLYVEFYWHEPVDKWASEEESAKQGKRVVVRRPKQPFVRIMRPGDQTSILETAVREEHKARWPEKWLYWQMAEGMIEGEKVPGWQLDEWPYLDDKPELLRELKFVRFQTVDQLAGASDAQIQKLGIGGLGLREQARVDLRNRMGKEFQAQIAEKDKKIADMEERMAKLEAAIMNSAPAAPVAPDAKSMMDSTERQELVAQYVAKHGRKPHGKMSVEKIRAALG